MSFSTLTETKKPLNSKLLVPSFPRKKAVEGVDKPSTYRVLFEDAYYARARDSLPLVEHADHLTPVRQVPKSKLGDLRHNSNACPSTAGFLRGNAATMLVPVCHVTTDASKADADCWWINDPGHVTHSQPGYSYDSTTRDAYRRLGGGDSGAQGVGRGASFRQKFTEAANGVVPVNPLWEKSGKTRLWTEKLSYEHQYNSRHRDNYPARGRRQGALVLRRLDTDEPAAADAFLASRGLHRNRSEADAKNAPVMAATDGAAAAAGERSELPFRPPNFIAYHRQFVRPDQRCRDSVAGLMQPEFRHPWNAPQPEPFFTG